MAIATTLRHYLEAAHIGYSVVRHPHTETSTASASSAHVDPCALAKAVLLSDDDGYLLAVLPASRALDLDKVESVTGRHLALADEGALTGVFNDCEYGAVPALGAAYGVETLVDETLHEHEEVFFEAGDHEVLLGVEGPSFKRLMADARFDSVCRTN